MQRRSHLCPLLLSFLALLRIICTRSMCQKLHRCTAAVTRQTRQTHRLFSTKLSADIDSGYENFSFEVIKSLGPAKQRLGLLKTPHGEVRTPAFIFCATKATIKGVSPEMLREADTQIILSNTYHLMLTPGSELVEKMGGLQKFSGWRGPMLTDSGGYQIFSMGFGSVSNEIKGKRNIEALGMKKSLLKINEQGATFQSYVDGSIHYLTPERSIEIQRQLGADLIVVLDECTPFNVDKDYTASSMRRSHRWALRSLAEFKRSSKGTQALYGIIQGGVYQDLRDESANFINTHGFFGTAIGGSLGADKKTMHDIVTYTRGKVRDDRPVHLLGIGGIRDIFNGVKCGIDTFDCVHPTRLGRHGGALVKAAHWDEKELEPEEIVLSFESTEVESSSDINPKNETKKKKLKKMKPPKLPANQKRTIREHISLDKARNRNDPRPIEPDCECYTCKNFSRAYIHHLFKAKEILASTLVTVHNIHFMNKLMTDIRIGIAENRLDEIEKIYIHPDLEELKDTMGM